LTSAHPGQRLGDLIHLQGDFHELEVLLIACRINLGLDLRLDNMVDRQSQRDSCQWPRPGRVPVRHGLSIELGAVRIRCAKDDDEVLFVILFCDLFDTLLTLQVKGTRRCSHKTLGLDQ
jgi:hypothetical protein